MLVHNCEHCYYKSNQRWCVRRHSSNKHQTHISKWSQPLPLQKHSHVHFHQPLPNIIVPAQVPFGSGQKKVLYSDDNDTLSEYSSHGKQHDFFDAESDSESDTELGEVLESIIDEIEEEFDNIIELRGRFRGSLDEIKDADTDKKKKILKKVAALIVKIFDEGVGINTEEDL